jgi:hypothetical protein
MSESTLRETVTGMVKHIEGRKIGQFALLSLRVGQLVATGVIAFVYCDLIGRHRFHFCHFSPRDLRCQSYGQTLPLDEVPWVYILTLFTVSASQLLS